MKLKEKVTFEEIQDNLFKVRLIESSSNGKAALTHYLHNSKNGVSQFYKKDAEEYLKNRI